MRPRFYGSMGLAACVLLVPVTLLASVDGSVASYQTLRFLHILGAILFLGNITVSAMWMNRARKSGNAAVLNFASTCVIRADWVFTLPGIILILVPGIMALLRLGGFGSAAWAELALVLFILSGVIWNVVLVPAQKKMLKLSRDTTAEISQDCLQAAKRWFMWGGIATLLGYVSLYLMVFKPTLWN